MTPRETEHEPFDVVVVGGGINGTSAARELAASGYRVLLAEKADLANGASSRSSRILHCGLRYFETHHPVRTFAKSPSRFLGALKMARTSMEARAELVGLQPQRYNPFTMCFPLYRGDDIRSWHLDIGFALLKRLGPPSPSLDYHRIPSANLERELPFVSDLRDRTQLGSVATYREYMIDWPDRICVDYALEAEQNGAALRLFTKASIRNCEPSGEWLVDLTDQSAAVETVRTKVVLNVTGTWIDEFEVPKQGTNPPLIRGTKGAHIVVRLPERYQGFGIATLHRGGMPFYCLPISGERFFFGPTETLYDGDANAAHPTREDIDFLLAEANYLLPGLKLQHRDVEFTWAGVRPLTYDPKLPMGRRTREIYDLRDRGLPGVFAMTAGPVMSHRSAGRELRDAVARLIPAPQTCSKPDIAPAAPTVPIDDLDAAIRSAILKEHARDLRGILYTRTGYAWGRHLDRETVERIVYSAADLLGWESETISEQIEDFLDHQRRAFPNGSAS